MSLLKIFKTKRKFYFKNLIYLKRSLGCIFYELIKLKLCFDGKDINEIQFKIDKCQYEAVENSHENYDLYDIIIKK